MGGLNEVAGNLLKAGLPCGPYCLHSPCRNTHVLLVPGNHGLLERTHSAIEVEHNYLATIGG